MDLKNLECFISVAEQLSFRRAAERLYVSQPSLSIRINALEDELGVKLFQRTRQRVYLTPEGAALLPAARNAIEKIYQLKQIVKNVSFSETDIHEFLNVGLDATEDRKIQAIDDVIDHFSDEYPEIDVRVHGVNIEEYEKKLLDKELDLCLMVLDAGVHINSMFLSVPILVEPTVMVTAEYSGESINELLRTREVQLLDREALDGRFNERYLSYVRGYYAETKVTYVSTTSLLIMNLLHGKTVTFLPMNYAQELENEKISILPIDIPHGNVVLTLVWNKYNINSSLQLIINEFMSGYEKL